MDRKLTEKEIAFLTELSNLMLKHNALLGAENHRVCIYVGDGNDEEEPIVLPYSVASFCDLEDLCNP